MKQTILEIVEEFTFGIDAESIAKRMNVNYQTVRYHLIEMEKNKEVFSFSYGRNLFYILPPDYEHITKIQAKDTIQNRICPKCDLGFIIHWHGSLDYYCSNTKCKFNPTIDIDDYLGNNGLFIGKYDKKSRLEYNRSKLKKQ